MLRNKDIDDISHSLSKLIVSKHLRCNLVPLVKNSVVLHPSKYTYLKLLTHNEDSPLKIHIRSKPKDDDSEVNSSKNERVAYSFGFKSKQERITMYISFKTQFPDNEDFQFKYENQPSVNVKFFSECVYVSLFSQCYHELELYYCFGFQQPQIVSQTHLRRKVESLEALSSFKNSSSSSLAKLKNL